MIIVCATMHPMEEACVLPTVDSWNRGVHFEDNSDENLGLILSYQEALQHSDNSIHKTLAYFHDDLTIHEENWDDRVDAEFEDAAVGVVGFGGATRLGSSYLYRRPYKLEQLARAGYRSNQVDAEAHGERFTGECDVAVLDGFALIVRRKLLEEAGGWPVGKFDVHCYDLWLCCMAARLGYRVRMVGVACEHKSGGKGVGNKYAEWLKQQGKTDADFHREAHEYIYKEFSDVLPIEVKP